MYNSNNLSQPYFCVTAHLRGDFIIHSGVSGDTTGCCFLLSHDRSPHSSLTDINTPTMCMHVCMRTKTHTGKLWRFFRQAPFFFSSTSEMEKKRTLLVLPAELIGRFPHHLQLQRLLTVSHTSSCNKITACSGGLCWQKPDHLKPLGMNS